MTSPGEVGGLDDEELVTAYVGGDAPAFDELVRRYERRVYAICHRYFGNAADAEDAAQDAFVALLRRAHTFRGTSSFSTWMYRVTTNACNDLARKRARRPQRVAEEPDPERTDLGSAPGVEDVLAARDLDPALQTALRQLDRPTRDAIVLHDVYGVGYAEIAAREDVAVGTVKSRIHRGHARLAAMLAGEPSSPPAPPTGQP